MFRNSLATRPSVAGALYGAGAGVAINAGWRIACPFPEAARYRSVSRPGPVESISKEHLGTCGVEVGPANGEREWLAGDGRIRGGTDARDGRRRRGSARNDANGEAVGDRPRAVCGRSC